MVIRREPNFLVFQFKRGDYKDSGTLFEETSKLAPQLRTFGVYYDNPEEVSEFGEGKVICFHYAQSFLF